MNGGKSKKQGIVDFEEVVQVAQRIVFTAQAITETRDRAISFDVLVVISIDIC
jgi:hypothetical protein